MNSEYLKELGFHPYSERQDFFLFGRKVNILDPVKEYFQVDFRSYSPGYVSHRCYYPNEEILTLAIL